jgi:hypothetical protein
VARDPAQPGLEAAVAGEALHVEAGKNVERVERGTLVDSGINRHGKLTRRAHRPAVERERAPAIERAAGQPVGDEERLDHRAQGEMCETRQQQDTDQAGLHGHRDF